MASLQFNQPLIGAGASVSNEIAAAEARTGINLDTGVQLKRGFKAHVEVEAFADASAELSKFIQLSVEGTAFARAGAGVQLQLPFNLFKDFGFCVKAEAIAEAAAGVEAAFAIKFGDFINLVKKSNELDDIAMELLCIFLEEMSARASFFINVSASAKAHASISVAGRVIESNGIKPGFYYTMDAGVGLAAGAGMGFSVGAEMPHFRRFYGRAVDKVVDKALSGILNELPDSFNDIKPMLGAFAPMAKIAFRCAFEIGSHIGNPLNGIGLSDIDGKTLCNESVKIVLEEIQRFSFHKFVAFGLAQLQSLIGAQINVLGQATWDAAANQRLALASTLKGIPDEPFYFSNENVLYWERLLNETTALTDQLFTGRGNPDPALLELISLLYCGKELLLSAAKSKIINAKAYAVLIGAGQVNANTRPYSGALSTTPPTILKTINNKIDNTRPDNQALDLIDLLQYLTDDILLDKLLNATPDMKSFISNFRSGIGGAERDVLKTFMLNAEAFIDVPGGGGAKDPQESLQRIVDSIDDYCNTQLGQQIFPRIIGQISDPALRLYMQEVLFGGVVYAKDIGMKTILNWRTKSPDKDDFTEALAGIMLLVIGRSAIITGDTFFTAGLEHMKSSALRVAKNIRDLDPAVDAVNAIFRTDALRDLVADCVEISADVLGPLNENTRARMRSLLYQVFEPLPLNRTNTFLDELANDFFIPNVEDMMALKDELQGIAIDRFQRFASAFVELIGQKVLDFLLDLIDAAIDLVLNWETHLADSLRQLADLLRDLENTLKQLNQVMISLMTAASNKLHALFQAIGNDDLRSDLRKAIKDNVIGYAFDLLGDNPVYKALPKEWKDFAKSRARSSVDTLIGSPMVTPLFNLINNIGDSLDAMIPDIRELNADEPLPEQLIGLILKKVKKLVEDHFGEDPHIDLGISFHIPFVGPVSITLGKIYLPVDDLVDCAQRCIDATIRAHRQFDQACFALADAFAAELDVVAQKLEIEKTKKAKDRKQQLSEEHNHQVKEIAILSPVPMGHYENGLDVKIQLSGVALSCLGLQKDEARRVLIYLNGNPVPPESLVVGAPPLTFVPRDVMLSGVNLNELKQFDKDTGRLENQRTILIADSAKLFDKQNQVVKNKADGSLAIRHAVQKSQPEAGEIFHRSFAGKKQAGFIKNYKQDARHQKGVFDYTLQNPSPGRKLSLSEENKLIERMIPGIYLQFKLLPQEMIKGVNVLTVAVIEKGGTRHQQNVSFTASAPLPFFKPGNILRPGSFDAVKFKKDKKTGKFIFGKKEENAPAFLPGKQSGKFAPPQEKQDLKFQFKAESRVVKQTGKGKKVQKVVTDREVPFKLVTPFTSLDMQKIKTHAASDIQWQKEILLSSFEISKTFQK